ncbi:uncharacterized protein LOC108411325 isoform X1 [Pygocentrus nattereri]|uniref:uncharacterized protein LOC108411325 isoform X1 n=1 Tax=Pygocentrus nattereri TaxID=42514 RepID=UPI001890F79C|nr:uncharacterized protein LOC108411325 isoform X1 [Pygocentrus nattereri]
MAESRLRDLDQYSCSICLDLMKNPVTIPCGHSYCMFCISSYWDMDKRNNCPQCRQNFGSRPVLNKNTMLADIMEKMKDTKPQAASLAQPEAEAGDVECDFCTGRKVRAVKSCLECRASYCEIHLQPHYDFPALMRHKLVNATFMPTCQKHDKLLEVFCQTDQKCICVLCLMDDHKGHDTVSCAKEREKKQLKLEADKSKYEEKCKEKEKELYKLQKATASHVQSALQAVEDTEKAFTESVTFIKKRHSEVIERIIAQEKADLDRLGDLREQLELEIAMLRAEGDVLDKLLQTEDNIHFLQNFENMPNPSGVQDSPSQSLELDGSFGNVSKAVSDFKERLEEICKQEADSILESVSDLSIKSSPDQIKIGDKVCVKSSVKMPKFNWGPHVTHKSIGEVKAVHGESLIVSFPGHEDWKGDLSEMELVTGDITPGASTQKRSIKVGDRVRVKLSVDTPKHKWGRISHQSVGVVKAFDGEAMTVDFPEHAGWKGVVSEMEIVSADDASGVLTGNNSFHIGDNVRVKSTVVTPKHQWGGATHKSVGVVTDIKEDTVVVDFPECKGWKGIISEMELLSSKDTEGCFRVGDRVRVKDSVSTPKNGWGRASHKSVGVVTAINGKSIAVDFPEHQSWNGIVSEMELAPSADSEYCKFKPGDRVRVKASVRTPKYNWGSVSHKSVGAIKALDGENMTVHFPEHKSWKAAVSEMELAP